MKNRHQATSFNANLRLPASWAELDDKQLRYFFKLVTAQLDSVQIKTHCLFRWSGLRLLHREGDLWRCKFGKAKFYASAGQIAELVSSLDYLDEIPETPVCISRWLLHRSLSADFSGVPLEKFIVADNLYQGFLATGQEPLLDQLLAVLYSRKWPLSRLLALGSRLKMRVSVFYWFASVKAHFSRLYPNFFKPAAANSGNLLGSAATQTDAVNAMLRALTKGDVTKEQEVLALDTHRALAELDAQAKEYFEFNSKYGK